MGLDLLDSLDRSDQATVSQLASDAGRRYARVSEALAVLLRDGLVERGERLSFGRSRTLPAMTGTTPWRYSITDKGREELAVRVAAGRVPGTAVDPDAREKRLPPYRPYRGTP